MLKQNWRLGENRGSVGSNSFFALGIYTRSNLNHGFMQSVGLGFLYKRVVLMK